MELVTIPTPEELGNRLTAGHSLLLANKWERAAIVYAYTDIGGPRNSAHHHPEPPKLTIRTFADRGYSGLKSVKAVQRYRRAWEYAVDQGWAKPSEPGGLTELPEEEFPSWDDFMHQPEFRQRTSGNGKSYVPPNNRLHFLTNLSTLKVALSRIIALLHETELEPEVCEVLIGYADALEEDARRLRDLATAREEVA